MKGAGQPMFKDVVLVGAGHSHVTVLRMFGMKPIPGVRFTLISREVHTPYSGMLPGLIAGHYGFDDAHIDTGPLARFAGARLYQDEAVDLDLAGRRVICRHARRSLMIFLSLNIGSTPNTADVPGASEHAIPVKPIDGFLAPVRGAQARVLARKGAARVALVGAGAGGVELLLSVEHRLRPRRQRRPDSTPANCRSSWCPTSPISCRAFRWRSARASTPSWRARGIEVITGAPVTGVEAGRLVLAAARRSRPTRSYGPRRRRRRAGWRRPDCRWMSAVSPGRR